MGKKKDKKAQEELLRLKREETDKKKSTGIIKAIVWSAIAIYFCFIM